jgi:hypothetical protein
MFRIKLWGIILLCFSLNCTRDKPARFERATSEGMQAMGCSARISVGDCNLYRVSQMVGTVRIPWDVSRVQGN